MSCNLILKAMRQHQTVIVVFLLILLQFSGSIAFSQDNGFTPRFNGENAFMFLYRQVEFGPRNPGSEGHEAAIRSYVDWFEQCDAEVELQYFQATVNTLPDSTSPTRTLRGTNIIARFGPTGSAHFLFCAHYDTRPWADETPDSTLRRNPIPGANDGASGVAVLLEMARLFSIWPPEMPIEMVLFDLEDSGVPGMNSSYCLGSSFYAYNRPGTAPVGAIVLDMIGEKDLEVNMEYFSYVYARDWTEYLFDIAEEVDSDFFISEIGEAAYDDHIHLLNSGIPTCNFIDFNYDYWHTHQDTPDKCSAESLEQVGRVLVYLVYNN